MFFRVTPIKISKKCSIFEQQQYKPYEEKRKYEFFTDNCIWGCTDIGLIRQKLKSAISNTLKELKETMGKVYLENNI